MSVELQKLRSELMRECLSKGWSRPGDVRGWTQVAPDRLQRWFTRLYQAPERPLPVGPRLLNHFQLGSDPEFVLTDGLARIDANALYLKAGPAFGADNNGRLVELRSTPTRSALQMIASLWLAMRWMGTCVPDVRRFGWRGGAYFEGDGLGGHIHFGRKRQKLREREIAGLDRLTHLMFTAGIFDREEGRMRVRHSQGAPHGHRYGELGDIRTQPHGYEYRTLPSWIDNPWLGYFTATCAKLMVALPDMVPPLTEADARISPEDARNQLRFLLAYYAPLDDDARLAFTILAKQGFPRHNSGLDIKASWGIFPSTPFGGVEPKKPDYVPSTIAPRPEDETELAMAMFEGRVPELSTVLEPTWTPSKLPSGYVPLIDAVQTRLCPGLGEFAMGLVIKKGTLIVEATSQRQVFRFPSRMSWALRNSVFAREFTGPWDCGLEWGYLHLSNSKDVSLEVLLEGRRLLLESEVLPLFDVNTVTAGSYENWEHKQALRERTGKVPKYLLGTRGGGE